MTDIITSIGDTNMNNGTMIKAATPNPETVRSPSPKSELGRLESELDKSRRVIEIQGKLSALLETPPRTALRRTAR